MRLGTSIKYSALPTTLAAIAAAATGSVGLSRRRPKFPRAARKSKRKIWQFHFFCLPLQPLKPNGALTKRLCGGLQNRIEQFDSATHLTMKSARCSLSSTCGFLLFILFPHLSVFPRHSYKALFPRHSYIASAPFLQCLNGILTLLPRHFYKTPIP